MQTYDVIIVGAGPAGLNCARILANAKLRVLLLEKNSVIGPKICAGGLTHKSYTYLTQLGLPDSLLGKKFTAVVMHTPLNQTRICADECIVATIARHDLGQWQLTQLRSSNVEVQTNARVAAIDLKQQTVTLHTGLSVGYKYLVGADGAISRVRQALGFKSHAVGVGMQYLLPPNTRFADLELFYHDRLFQAHYAWIFPQRDYVSVGCGGNLDSISYRTLLANFHTWLKQQKIELASAKLQSFPFNHAYKGFDFGKVFLIGEAAGLISSFTGEGIYQALISGEEVAQQILTPNFVPEKLQQIVRRKLRHDQLVGFFTKSSFLRKIEFELIALAMKNQKFARKVLTKI